MMQKRSKYILIAIFVLVLALRLYFSFTSSNFATDESYFNLRHIQSVLHGEVISFHDDLSFGGRVLLSSPLFYVVLAVLSFGNIFALKIVNEILLSSLVIIIYLICRKISNSEGAGLLGSLISNVSPIFLENTTNILSPYTLSIPLIFLMFYLVMNLNDKKYLIAFIVLSFILPFIHAASFLFVLTLLCYFLLLAGGALQSSKLEKQALLLSLFSMVLMTLILYKKVLLNYGLSAIWQNLPTQMIASAYSGLDFTGLIVGVGVIPIVFGFSGLYFGFFREKNKGSYLCGSFMIAILALVAFKFLAVLTGLMLLAVCLGIMSSFSLDKVVEYIRKLNVGRLRTLLIVCVVIIIPSFLIFSSVVTLSSQAKVNDDVVQDMIQLKAMNGTLVAGNINEGNLISGIAWKGNVIDNQFLLAPKPIERMKDLELLYKAGSSAFAEEVINKYKIDVIYLSDESKAIYNVKTLYYADNDPCFVKNGKFYSYICKKR